MTTQNLRLLSGVLVKNGFRASVAANGRAMAQALRAAQIDLIILDILMPGEDGLSLCRRLRADGTIPIIMLTARGSEVDRVVGLRWGPTTIWLSRSASANCWPASALFFGVRPCPRTARHPVLDRSSNSRAGASTRPPANCAPLADALVDLRPAEFELLLAFVEHPQQILKRERLLELAPRK